jgi:hypothetical protein
MATGGSQSGLAGGKDLPFQYNELSIHAVALFTAAILAGVTSHWAIKRRHKRIWAEIRASQPTQGQPSQ